MSGVKFTRHAEEMLIERKFEREFVIDVDNPEWREEGEGDIMPSGELEKELFV